MMAERLTRAAVCINLVFLVVGSNRAKADFAFGVPRCVGGTVNSGVWEGEACISSDSLSLYYCRGTLGVYCEILVATRTTTDGDWTSPAKVSSLFHSSMYTGGQHICADGLTLYYSPMIEGEYGGPGDIWMVTRATAGAPWNAPVNLGLVVNSTFQEWHPSVTADELVLCFASDRAGGSGAVDLWITTRPSKADGWSPPSNLGTMVNSPSFDGHPAISSDGLVVFFQSNRSGGYGGYDLWMTTRKTRQSPWTSPVNLGRAVNTAAMEGEPAISADGSILYFSSDRAGGPGNGDLWQVPILPTIDLNGDERVDVEDFCRFAKYWGKENASMDMAPGPFGDGLLDVEDLAVLCKHWLQEVPPASLVAHWKLDEAEGDIAHDETGRYDGDVRGGAKWCEDEEALELDGVDDYVEAPFVLKPGDGPFSVFAWVKTGAEGKAIISQTGTYGVNWLAVDAAGRLVTELQGSGRGATPLPAGIVITDDQWHRVGFTWDGSYRTLYVDDIEVARDASPQNVTGANGGLHIGADKTISANSLFSGLIDDVRVYNQAIEP